MGRLIDADKLKEMLEDEFCADCKECARKPCRHNDIQDLIDNIPTAYDVEKVVAELEELPNREADYYYAHSNDVIDREDAIDIVRKGGVE